VQKKDNIEAGSQPKPKKPPGWRAFQKVLKVAVTTPPLKRIKLK
jgi:hypothetical protein